MPRFYFDSTVNGEAMPDGEGVFLPSVAAARKEAMIAATDMAKDGGASPQEIVIVVRDRPVSEPVVTVRLSLTYE
jgi:hypothetical protein